MKLSSSHYDLQSHYPVVVIGSGYGGAIMAARLARAKQAVCLLEKGQEFQVGEYPNNELAALKNLQMTGLNGCPANNNGLYHLYFDKEISALVGCGLGGTSLINANVALRAEPRIFEENCWPEAFKSYLNTLVKAGYDHAETMLKPTPYPEDFPALAKLKALEKSAEALEATCYRPPIAVNFKDQTNHVGIAQQACKLCGDCVSGCNYAAKNTLIMNYLPDAKHHGASIFCEMDVQYLEYLGGRWVIYYHDLSSENNNFPEHLRFITADLVVLSAGTLGSTEILLRSKMHGMTLSEKVGDHFTGNGDVLAFGYDSKMPINGIGYGAALPQGKAPVGPCITGIIDCRQKTNLAEGIVIEEGSIPGGMAGFLPQIFALSAQFAELNEAKNWRDALTHTQTYLVMSHDNGKGKLLLENDVLRIDWSKVGEQPNFIKINEILSIANQPLGGPFMANPLWSKLSDHTLVTVHPLGGCIMGEDVTQGVVNYKGQVFSNRTKDAVYNNLYVCDGAIIPRSLGINPLLTISAIAEYCAALLAQDRKWAIDYTLPSVPKTERFTEAIGLTFTETMRGRLSRKHLGDYEKAFTDIAATPFEFTLTIVSSDLQKMLTSKDHSAKIIGEVSIPTLSKQPLLVTQGEFKLFVNEERQVNTKKMVYQLLLTSVEGNYYEFEGYKLIHNDPLGDVWSDTTTLFVTIYDYKHNVCAKGILKILPADFMQQLTTLKVLNTDDPAKIVQAKMQFSQFFAETVYQIYGGVFAKTAYFHPEAPMRLKRKLRVDSPEVYEVTTADQQHLRLLRYRGGNKGPVILSHGLGVSSLIFAIDTIDVNLLEYLYAHQYDVWLLDYRASIDLPAANQLFSADEIATYDYPKAVEKVLQITKAKDVQMIAHCFGATTLCMAMLAGLKGVRSILFSQMAAHIVAPDAQKIKAGLYLPTFLRKLNVNSLTAYADNNAEWHEKLFDQSLKLQGIQCENAVCHRIAFLYGELYEHDQLNQLTHDYLHEMFGVANIKSFEHLALMVRKGHLVNSAGEDSYLPHLERLALPITFIHGAENHCFLPESTALTYELLQEKNGSAFYKRHVIPNYGHLDCIFGKNAAKDVYPFILEHLETTLVPTKDNLILI